VWICLPVGLVAAVAIPLVVGRIPFEEDEAGDQAGVVSETD
jgi:hypothetical protein